MALKENTAFKEDEFKEDDEEGVDFRHELEAALKELNAQKKMSKRTIMAMKDMQCLVEVSEEEKMLLEERIVELEKELAIVQEDAFKHQGCAKEKEDLKNENESLLRKIGTLTLRVEEQMKIHYDMVAKMIVKTSCSEETSSKRIEEARKEASSKLKECLARQRPYTMGRQGLGFVERKPTHAGAKSSCEAKEVKQRSFAKFHGNCYSCGKYSHYARECMQRIRMNYERYVSSGNSRKWYGDQHHNKSYWRQDKVERRVQGFVRRFQPTSSFHCSLNNRFQSVGEL